MISPYIVVDEFFAGAEEMRFCFERHFANPHHDYGPSHQIWDYWHVPGLYTYLRTDPARVLSPGVLFRFFETLKDWAAESLGMSQISPAYLSLYIDGCGQGLHNDSSNGRWGFVYSLTRWEERRFTGGETLIFKDTGYWETDAPRHAGAGSAFYDLVPARFNQLLVFDDRLIHAVPHIQGIMTPQEGRVVVHGHIREGRIQVRGALGNEQVEKALSQTLAYIQSRIVMSGNAFHGCVSVRFAVAADGSVQHVGTLSDRLYRTSPRADDPGQVVSDLVDFLRTVRFPRAGGKSLVTVPIPIG